MAEVALPERGEVRENRSDRFYVVGPPERPWEYVVPITMVVQVEGHWVGQKFGVATEAVATWRVVSNPV